jgi:hypothetical protein
MQFLSHVHILLGEVRQKLKVGSICNKIQTAGDKEQKVQICLTREIRTTKGDQDSNMPTKGDQDSNMPTKGVICLPREIRTAICLREIRTATP